MKVLFMTTVLPARRRGGGEIVSQQVVETLRRLGHEVVVLGYRRSGDAADVCEGERCAGERPIETSEAGWRSLAWAARALASGSPYSSTKYRSRSYTRAVSAALDERPDLLVVDHAQVHFALALPAGLPPVVHVAHNAESLLYRDLSAGGRKLRRALYSRESRLLDTIETRLADRAAQVWTLTDADAAYFRRRGADARTLSIGSSLGLAPELSPAYDVALVGNWTWRANAAGLEWFLGDVVPRLDPALTVAVAGLGSREIAAGEHPVSALGMVPDVSRFLSAARVVAVPSVSGAGLQVKTLDAIASGLPVVATSIAVRGITDLPASVSVEDGAPEFARTLGRAIARTDRVETRRAAAAWSARRRQRLEHALQAAVGEIRAAGSPVARTGAEATRVP